MSSKPVVYLFHGDNEFAIQQAIKEIQDRSASGGMGDMNVSILDGRNATLEELRNIALALPFLADRRVVILHHPLARFRRKTTGIDGTTNETSGDGSGKAAREAFLALLEEIPASTALVLAEYTTLEDVELAAPYSSKRVHDHWLVKWAKQNPTRVFIRAYQLPRGAAMARWIQSRARELGGQISLDAAGALSNLVGTDTRTADHELQKLLAYVNYRGEIELDDVVLLVADIAETSVFDLVDALGLRNATRAMELLTRLLEDEDPLRLFGMVVRQFRLLLMAREVVDDGGGEADIARLVKVHSYVARKLNEQVRQFSLPDLEAVYHKLLEIDRGVKTSQIEMPVALNMLVAATAADQ
jgi:DNA polymerase-3 subunit delta